MVECGKQATSWRRRYVWSSKGQLAFQGLNLAIIVLSTLMIWKSFVVVTKSENPIVVVASG